PASSPLSLHDALPICWSALRLAQVKGAMVRPLPPDPRALQLQFVLQPGQRLESLRQDVVKQWLWPVKPRDAGVARKDRDHPVVRSEEHTSELQSRGHL